jgi:hypothetical protein
VHGHGVQAPFTPQTAAVRRAKQPKYAMTKSPLRPAKVQPNIRIAPPIPQVRKVSYRLSSFHIMDAHRAVRPPPSRRALFHSTAHNPPAHPSTRRQNPTSVRPDTTNIFTQPMEGELVERDQKGEYVMCSPQTTYKHLALGLSGGRNGVDEDTGMFANRRDESTGRLIRDRARKRYDPVVREAKPASWCCRS